MSYDISLYDSVLWEHHEARACPPWEDDPKFEHRCPGDAVEVGNITYNIAPMWADALAVDEALTVGGGISRIMGFDGDRTPYGIHRFEGAPAVEAAGPLRAAIERMESNPDHYRAMNPPNGWGKYEHALEFLQRLYARCVENPAYRIHIS